MTFVSWAWWKAALLRGLRTAVVITIPYVAGSSLLGISWLSAASAAGLGFVLSILTSLAGLAEAKGVVVPVWLALVERVTKTGAQSLVAGIGTAVLVQDVDWHQVLQASAIAALGSLLIGVLGFLPESDTSSGTLIDAGAAATDTASVITSPTVPLPQPDVTPLLEAGTAGTPPTQS